MAARGAAGADRGAAAGSRPIAAFRSRRLLYWLIAVHSLVLILGGHYTYAQVPLGFWMQDAFGFARNHYDRIGHLMQGIGPAIVDARTAAAYLAARARQVAVHRSMVFTIPRRQRHLPFSSSGGPRWRERGGVGRIPRHAGRGPWDTRWDMFLAGCGAIASQLQPSSGCTTGSSPRWIRRSPAS